MTSSAAPTVPVDWAALGRWIEQRGIEGVGRIVSSQALAAGSQNIVVRVETTGRPFVLRRPPLESSPRAGETLAREASVLEALSSTDVPHPDLYAFCADESVIGAPFIMMAAVDGTTPFGEFDGEYGTSDQWRRELAFSLVDALVALASLDPHGLGLGHLGSGEDWLERQTTKYSRVHATYATQGFDHASLPEIEATRKWLDRNRPESRRVGVVHGDVHFANVIADGTSPRVKALIDWELATIGDPRLDFGALLSGWHETGDPSSADPIATPWVGMPARLELCERYTGATGDDPEELAWFEVFAAWRLAIILDGTLVRARQGKASLKTGLWLHDKAVRLARRACVLAARLDR